MSFAEIARSESATVKCPSSAHTCARKTPSKMRSPISPRSASRSPRSMASSTSCVSSSRKGRSDSSVCSRSHGQPCGPRSRAMMSTSPRKAGPAAEAMRAVWYHRGVSEYADELDESFANLIVYIGQMAAMAFGDIPDASGERSEPNIEAAGMFIEMLGMLQEKTRGNLTAAEAKVLEGLLYDLRMRYVQVQQGGGQKRIIEP